MGAQALRAEWDDVVVRAFDDLVAEAASGDVAGHFGFGC